MLPLASNRVWPQRSSLGAARIHGSIRMLGGSRWIRTDCGTERRIVRLLAANVQLRSKPGMASRSTRMECARRESRGL